MLHKYRKIDPAKAEQFDGSLRTRVVDCVFRYE